MMKTIFILFISCLIFSCKKENVCPTLYMKSYEIYSEFPGVENHIQYYTIQSCSAIPDTVIQQYTVYVTAYTINLH